MQKVKSKLAIFLGGEREGGGGGGGLETEKKPAYATVVECALNY